MIATQPLIITAELDSASFEFFNALRQKHFPPERNFLGAHLTLFHHLPGDRLDEISENLSEIANSASPVNLRFVSWRFLGRGVAMNVESSELNDVRRAIAALWNDHLTPQDKQPFRPHITVQNKVEPESGKSLLAELSENEHPPTGMATGLRLSRYLGGPWEKLEIFDFSNEVDR